MTVYLLGASLVLAGCGSVDKGPTSDCQGGRATVIPQHNQYSGRLAMIPQSTEDTNKLQGGMLTLCLSADRTAVTKATVHFDELECSFSDGSIKNTIVLTPYDREYSGQFPLSSLGQFSIEEAGITGRFLPDDTAEGTINLKVTHTTPTYQGTPETRIAGTPDVVLPDGSLMRGSPEVVIPGTPKVEGVSLVFSGGSGTWRLRPSKKSTASNQDPADSSQE